MSVHMWFMSLQTFKYMIFSCSYMDYAIVYIQRHFFFYSSSENIKSRINCLIDVDIRQLRSAANSKFSTDNDDPVHIELTIFSVSGVVVEGVDTNMSKDSIVSSSSRFGSNRNILLLAENTIEVESGTESI